MKTYKGFHYMMRRIINFFHEIASTDLSFSPDFCDFYDRKNDLFERADQLMKETNDLFEKMGFGGDKITVKVDYNEADDKDPDITVNNRVLKVNVLSKDGNNTHTVTTTIPDGYDIDNLQTNVDSENKKFVIIVPKTAKKVNKKKQTKTNPFFGGYKKHKNGKFTQEK